MRRSNDTLCNFSPGSTQQDNWSIEHKKRNDNDGDMKETGRHLRAGFIVQRTSQGSVSGKDFVSTTRTRHCDIMTANFALCSFSFRICFCAAGIGVDWSEVVMMFDCARCMIFRNFIEIGVHVLKWFQLLSFDRKFLKVALHHLF